MAVNLSLLAGAGAQFFTNSGVILSGGLVYTYAAGTTTPQAAYTTSAGSTAHTNPIVLDSAGRVPSGGEIWLTDAVSYKFVLQTSLAVLIATYDNITGNASGIYAAFAASSGSSLVGFIQSGTGAVATTVQSKLRESVSVKDFGATGDGTTNDSAAINLAIATNRNVWFPAGTYLIATSVVVTSKNNVLLQGAGANISIIKCSASATFSVPPVDVTSSNNVQLTGLTFDSNSNASVTASLAMVRFVSCTNIAFSDNSVLHSYIGVGVDSCTRFRVERNYIAKNAIATTINYNINVSSTVSVSTQGEVNDNFCTNSGSGFIGNQINISRNQFLSNSYGAGIATFGSTPSTIAGFFGKYYVSDNTCHNGTQRDVDGFMVAGMEIAGPYSRIENNTVSSNAGEGIRLFAFQSICSGNNVFSNGTGLDGTFKQAGIVPCDATTIAGYNASYSTIIGNQCFDSGGSTQTYGYYEQQSTLLGMTVQGNNFNNNVTGPYVLASSKVSNTYDFDTVVSYTPTMTSTTGTITTVGARTGEYFLKGRLVYFQAQGTITTNGTGATSIQLTLPITASATAASRWVIPGRADVVSGKSLVGVIAAGGTAVVLTTYDALYPGADGEKIAVTGWYQI
jgi:hypothetical protein